MFSNPNGCLIAGATKKELCGYIHPHNPRNSSKEQLSNDINSDREETQPQEKENE